MASYNLEALVIKARPLVEADILVTLFSRERGKIRAAARGTKKPRSRLSAGLLPFTHGRYQLWEARNLDGVRQAQVLTSFSYLREDLDLMCHAGHMAWLADAFTTEGDPSEPFFLLLLTSFSLLQGLHPGLVRRFYEIRALGVFGFRPEVEVCASCGGQLSQSGQRFSSSAGGILCRGCRSGRDMGRSISPKARKLLALLQWVHPRQLSRITWPEPGSGELEIIMDDYLAYVLDRPLPTGLLESLAKESPPGPGRA